MTQRERMAAYLQYRGREGATNGEIKEATGLPHAKVYQLTQAMVARGEVRARRLWDGGKWHFTWRKPLTES